MDLFLNELDTDESDMWFPQEVVEANVVRGDNLLKAWREHLGLNPS